MNVNRVTRATLGATLLAAASCSDGEPSYVLDNAKLRANEAEYFKARDKFAVAQVCGMRAKFFSDFALFIAPEEIRFESNERITDRGNKEKVVARSRIADGVFSIPEEVARVKVASRYRIVDSGREKFVELVASGSDARTTCKYPLKRR
jgi:hypothetical protein